MPPMPPRGRETVPQGRQVLYRQVRDRAPQLPARAAWPEEHAPFGLWRAVARKAEVAPHLRPARAPVPQHLSRRGTEERDHGRDAAADARVAAPQYPIQ